MDPILGYSTFILEYGIIVQKQFRDFEKKKKKKKKTKGYGIFVVNYFGNGGILGPPRPQNKPP